MNLLMKTIGIIIGSLRKESFCRKAAQVFISMAPKNVSIEIIEIADLSMYNQDLDDAPPQPWIDFRAKVKGLDAILFITPEYNRSVPAVLKNALDVGSRPYGQSAWEGKPGAVMSLSPGALGGFGANHHLRQTLVFLNVIPLQQPEAYIGGAATLFDENGNLVNESTKTFFKKFLDAFLAFSDKFSI
jgi:chromate reductase